MEFVFSRPIFFNARFKKSLMSPFSKVISPSVYTLLQNKDRDTKVICIVVSFHEFYFEEFFFIGFPIVYLAISIFQQETTIFE